MNGTSEVLSHRTRKMLYEYILGHPGISYQMIRDAFRLNDGTLRYHLDRLVRADLVLLRKKKNNRCYIPLDGVKASGMTVFDRKCNRVLDIIKSEPGIGRVDLMRRSDLSRKELTSVLSRLKSNRMIWKVGSGRSGGYEYISEDRLYREMIRILTERYVRDEIDIDRFLELKEDIDDMFS
ncbi:MAG: helix-turn-helix domain-containing protein [Thermoplasmatota archaeon]